MRRQALALFYVGPLVVWLAVIFAASTPAGASAQSVSWVTRVLLVLEPEVVVTPQGEEMSNALGRKLAHLAEYAVLGALLLRALQFGRRRLRWYALPGALLLCAVLAAADEVHQRFVPGRTASAHDALVDTVGGALALAALGVWYAVRLLEQGLWRRHAGHPPDPVPEQTPAR